MAEKVMYKYEIAERIGISRGRFSYWLNVLYFDELVKIGYDKNQKYLTPSQIDYLKTKLCFD